MAQQDAASRIAAGTIIIVGLASVWISIVTSLPSQEELSAKGAAGSVHAVAGVPASSPGSIVPAGSASPAEPALDLSIPGAAPSSPPELAQSLDQDASDRLGRGTNGSVPTDPRVAQIMRLKCEAEIEQLCPDSAEGPGRARCLERRAKDLPLPCQSYLRERFVKWKEDRSRTMAACQEDVRRLCATMRPGDGRVMQCLQEHAQEVSDRCYQTLPKGTLFFRQ